MKPEHMTQQTNVPEQQVSEAAREAEKALRFHENPANHERFCRQGNLNAIQHAIDSVVATMSQLARAALRELEVIRTENLAVKDLAKEATAVSAARVLLDRAIDASQPASAAPHAFNEAPGEMTDQDSKCETCGVWKSEHAASATDGAPQDSGRETPSPPTGGERTSQSDDPRLIYELIDASDEEMYYPIGLFLSLDAAVRVVESQDEPWTLSEYADDTDYCHLELRERKIGFSDYGKRVREWEWSRDYDAPDDSFAWKPRSGSTNPKGISSTVSAVLPSESCGSTNAAGGSSPVGSVEAEGQLLARINEYLANGGLFNPELMAHDKVRELFIDIRDHLARLRADGRAETGEDTKRLDWLCSTADFDDFAVLPDYLVEARQFIDARMASSNPEPVSSPASSQEGA